MQDMWKRNEIHPQLNLNHKSDKFVNHAKLNDYNMLI